MTNSYTTLAGMFTQQDGEGNIASKVIEMLAPACDLINDAYVGECNSKDSNVSVIRTKLPEPEFRAFYQGAKKTASATRKVVDTCGQLTDYSVVDKTLCDRQKNPGQYRLNEAQAHLMGFQKKIMKSMLYGDTKSDPLGFDGLARRYGKKSTTENTIGKQIIDGGATSGACTSVFLITFGENDTKLLYPEGSKAGIIHENCGVVQERDDKGKEFQAYKDYWEWNVGLAVGNFKSNARVANISVEELRKGNIDCESLLLDLYYATDDDRVNGLNKSFIYASKEFYKQLHKKILNKTNVNLSFGDYAGKKVMQFIDIPLRSCKEIRMDEDVVSQCRHKLRKEI